MPSPTDSPADSTVPSPPASRDASLESALLAARFALLGAVSAFVGVALGAFGAHGLEGRVTPADLGTWETGVRYHMYHALALFAVAWLASRRRTGGVALAGWLFVAGTVVFSGSLYALVLTGQRWLGAVTPLGGLAFLAGWATLAVTARVSGEP